MSESHEVESRKVGVQDTAGRWVFMYEWPYCRTCGCYTWEHEHAGDTAGVKYPSTRDDELLAALGLAGRPPLADVRAAYRKLMLQHHPDKGGDPAVARMLISAYDELRARGLAP